MDLPKVTTRPCNDCPWRRTAPAGWLGPMDAEDWIRLALSDEPIACHQTLVEDRSWEGASQCAGAADFRSNICKSPRDPNVAQGSPNPEVFARPNEFIEYHEG